MRDEDDFSQDVKERQMRVFELYVGHRKKISYAALEDLTHTDEGTWRTYAAGTAMPLHNVLRLIKVLPKEAANMLIEPSERRLVPLDASKTDWLLIGENMARIQGKIYRYERTDGFIDHGEDADLRQELRIIVADVPGGPA